MNKALTTRVVHYAAQECAWQGSGELSVAQMVEGWLYAHRYRNQPIAERDILALGMIIEPQLNAAGFRMVNVRVGTSMKMDASEVPGAIKLWLATAPVRPTEAQSVEHFRQYEEIHPFRDGNGRSGSLIYNWMRGSLEAPIHAPNLWGDYRRNVPDYPVVNARNSRFY